MASDERTVRENLEAGIVACDERLARVAAQLATGSRAAADIAEVRRTLDLLRQLAVVLDADAVDARRPRGSHDVH